MRLRLGAIAVTVTMLCFAGSSFAQSENFEAVSAAKKLFEQGQKQLEEKNYVAACASFKASNEAVARIGTLLNLGDCYEKNGQYASAWGAYFDAINLARRQSRPDYEEYAQKKKDELEPKLLKLVIVVPDDAKVDGMKIARDGRPVDAATWGVPIAVDAGKHSIEVTAPHKQAFRTETTLDETHREVEIKITKLEEAPTAWPRVNQPEIVERVAPVPSAWTPIRVSGVVAGSAGIVAIALGSVLGLVANDKYHGALTKDCLGDPNNCSPVGVSNAATARDLANVATGLFIGGLVVLGGGVALFIVGTPSRPRSESHTSLRLDVLPLASGGVASLGGTF